uniref:Leucine-rich repeat-containing N-terminal plant-type domain-containing protein n=1 Tax=Salix viminalis TaxID=40686 RepID=A0A6N2M8Q7_SALVM
MPGSNFFASWDFTSDPCNFAGVYCESDRVIALNLGDPRAGSPGLTGRLDPAIGKLSALTELSVVPGRIMGSLPQSISQLKDLRFLAVSRNFLSGGIPATLGQLRNLKTLDLSYNQLTGDIPRSIGTIPGLSNVILSHNHISGSIPTISLRNSNPARVETQRTLRLHLANLPSSFAAIPLSFLEPPLRSSGLVIEPARPVKLSGPEYEPALGLYSEPDFHIPNNQPSTAEKLVFRSGSTGSYNRLSGGISPLFSTVQSLYLNNNRFTGQIPGSFADRLLDASIQILYLQHNYLTGMQINPTVEIPLSSSLCLQYNCMVPPIQTPCPLKAGMQKTRPTGQCNEWRG